jgi:UDP-glucose 4-epimerase
MNHAGQRALVLGGLGFIGSNLAARLLTLGADVSVVTPVRERHEAAAARLEGAGARVLEGDIRDHHFMSQAVVGQSLILNLSGQSGAVRSMEDPWTDLDVNCRGNLVLLDTVREHNPGARLVFVGSRLQYGRPAQNPVREDQANEALCVHAIHKQTVEQYYRLYHRLFGIRFTIARLTNPYGPGQPKGRTAYGVVNRMIHLALAGEPITIYGDGLQQRDYIHIDDVVDALVALAGDERADSRAFNVGSGTGTRMIDLARLVIELAGRGRVQHVAWPRLAEQIETGDFVADVSAMARVLDWRPRISLREGLSRTIAAYRAYQTA